MTPQQWNELFASGKSPRVIKQTVAMEVRKHLAELAPGMTLTTTQIVDVFYPRAVAEQNVTNDFARSRIIKLILGLAHDDLADCCVKGEQQGMYMGRPKHPWVWFCPEEVEICPSCGQVIAPEVV